MWRDFISTQQRHNEHVLETNRRLAVAMTLPQPDVPKFTGDPLDYQPFIMAFKAHIESKTHLADCLYYLNQYLDGEPKELISGCLYENSIERYCEAKRLLNHEYGDPYQISTAYINKVLSATTLKFEDPIGLRRFSFFLKKCNEKFVVHDGTGPSFQYGNCRSKATMYFTESMTRSSRRTY